MSTAIKPNTNCSLTLIFLLSIIGILNAQNCLEYPEIEGSQCTLCTPDGWDVVSDTPDLLDPVTSICNPSPSPSGGTAIRLWANGNNHFEAVSTTFTVPDFVDGQQYYFGLYYTGCGSHTYTMLITINGEEFEVQPDDSWEYFEACIVLDSEEVEIEIEIEFYDTGQPSSTMVDTGICDEDYCCALDAEIEEEQIEMCPGDEQQIVVNVFDEVGNTDFNWTCEPEYGINFLDDPTSANPILSVPFDDADSQTFIYRIEIEDEECIIFREFEFLLNTSDVPEFDIFLCEIYEEYELPLMSNEGYFGTWEGEFAWDELGGTVQEYTFTLNPGQENCIQEWSYSYLIELAEPVSFEFQTVYCVNDDETYRLPKDSEEGVEGDWYESKFTPEELGVGTYQFVFEIDQEYYCAEDYILEIEILPDQDISFDVPIEYCISSDTIFLPDTSIQGVYGTWTQEFIDLNIVVDNEVATFNSEDNGSCNGSFDLIYSVKEEVQVSFDIPDSLCRSVSYLKLDSFSVEGYIGFWSPQELSFDTIGAEEIELLWTPLDSSACLSAKTLTLKLIESQELVFNLPPHVCAGTGVYVLPSVSDNGLPGVWNIPAFDPDTLSSTFIDLSFIPEEQCAEVYTHRIEVNSQLLDVSDFNFETVLCGNAEAFELPLSNINGVEGEWSQAIIDPSVIMDSLIVSFYPDNSNGTCYDTLEVRFFTSDIIEPTFNIPALLCAKHDEFEFPVISIEGISGHWDTATFNPADWMGQDVLNNIFYPDDPSCYSELEISIELYDFSGLDYSVYHSNSCIEPNGELIVNTTEQIELSLDNGLSWTETNMLNNLDGGNYTVMLRHVVNLCLDTLEINIESPEPVEITDLQIDSIKDCSMQGASVNCVASGSNLEFSLNDSNLWTDEMYFDNLTEGEYWIYTRNANAPDCIDSSFFEISPFEQTVILDLIANDVSGCEQMDGSIEIIAQGQNIEHSINAGQDWQNEPLFENLGFGVYNILVRSRDAFDCSDEGQLVFTSPEVPSILMIEVVDQNSCVDNNGSIRIEAEGNELEYSVDGGMTWSESSLFENLAGGNYLVVVREKDDVECYSNMEVEIQSPVELEILDVDVKQPSSCFNSDAFIEVTMNLLGLQFSLDNGVSWQTDNRFSNIEEGNYELLIIHPDYPDCESSYLFEISYPDCPCNELLVTFSSEPVDCLDPLSGSVSISAIEGNIISGDIQVVWSNGTEGMEVVNLPEGWVFYVIDYDKNCSLTDSVYVESIDPISFELLSFDQDCEGLGVIEVIEFTGGAGSPAYSIDGINFQENEVFSGLSAQEYQVFVEDLFNCTGENSVVINDNSDLQLDLPGVEPISKGEVSYLNPLINEETIDSFEWYPMEGILNPGNLIAQVSPEQTTSYTLTIYFGDCVEIRTVTVEVIADPELYIANMFSPNNDGNNDDFLIQSDPDQDIIINSFLIYDRWGNLVFEAEDFKTNSTEWAWDGTFNGKVVNPGVFIYLVRYTHNNSELVKHGTITLVK